MRNSSGDTPSSSPSTSPTNSPNEPHYFDTLELKYNAIDSIDNFNVENNCSVKELICPEYIEYKIFEIIVKEDNSIIGIKQEMAIWQNQIHNISVCAYINNNFVDFITFTDKAAWNNIEIDYLITHESIYSYYIQFVDEDILYNVNINCYEEMDISVLLNMIFS
jgi:hypothetical protein